MFLSKGVNVIMLFYKVDSDSDDDDFMKFYLDEMVCLLVSSFIKKLVFSFLWIWGCFNVDFLENWGIGKIKVIGELFVKI